MGYHTIGRFAIGRRALGFSSGFAVNVGNDEPGPQRIMAWSPGEGAEMAWGIAGGARRLWRGRVEHGAGNVKYEVGTGMFLYSDLKRYELRS